MITARTEQILPLPGRDHEKRFELAMIMGLLQAGAVRRWIRGRLGTDRERQTLNRIGADPERHR
jgi:hypothetical protein